MLICTGLVVRSPVPAVMSKGVEALNIEHWTLNPKIAPDVCMFERNVTMKNENLSAPAFQM